VRIAGRLQAPFGERVRVPRGDDRLVSRGLLVESGPQHRARQALRKAEQLSRAVVEGLEEGVVVTNDELRAVSWNASALAILRLEPSEIRGLRAPFFADGEVADSDGHPITSDDNPVTRAVHGAGRTRALLRRSTAAGEQWLTLLARPISTRPGALGGMVCTFADVTASVQVERSLREQRDRAERYLEVASTMVVVLSHLGRIELVNRQGCELLGFDEEEIIGRDWFTTVVAAEDRLDARRAFSRLASGVEPAGEALETGVQTKAGERRQIAWRNAVLRDASGGIVSVLRSGEDVTERRAAEAQIEYLAFHDALTGLPKRAMLEDQLRRDIARARRTGCAVALLYLDLDGFKLVNDSLGHSAGDHVLCEAARRVSTLTRGGDLFCRQGGDEFLLLLNCEYGEDAEQVARRVGERICEALERPFETHDAEFHVGASIGAALFPGHAEDAESLLSHADAAMYQAKGLGGRGLAFYEEVVNDSRRRLSLTSSLRRAVSNGELRLHYQPIFQLPGQELSSIEALVRWQHPDEGLLSPGVFIPIAEQTGLIDAISEWVIEELCRQATRWAAVGWRPMLTFNISPRQSWSNGLPASIVARIDAHGLVRSQFCVELTETAVLSDERRQRSLLSELHEAGLKVAIDDFGAGHSSLARLRDLPVHMLKVDRSFLGRVPEDERSSAIVVAILELGAALGMDTVVEGVEYPQQLQFLREHGCSLVQGFLLGRPVPGDEIDLTRMPQASGIPHDVGPTRP
jgi:diguanylate cyclase (GGDEF)-like protein/PAS domain S-box-containing protein